MQYVSCEALRMTLVLTLNAHHFLQTVTFHQQLLFQYLGGIGLSGLVLLDTDQCSCDLGKTLSFSGKRLETLWPEAGKEGLH